MVTDGPWPTMDTQQDVRCNSALHNLQLSTTVEGCSHGICSPLQLQIGQHGDLSTDANWMQIGQHGSSVNTMAKTRGGRVTASRRSTRLAERGWQQPQTAAGQMPSGFLASRLPSPSPSSTSNPPSSQSPSQHYRCPSHSPSFHRCSPSQQSTAASRPCSCSPRVAARGLSSLSPSPTSNPPTSQSPSQHYRCPSRCPSHSPSFHMRSPSQQSTVGSHPCPRSPGVAARAHPRPPFLLLLPSSKPVLPTISVPPKFPLLLTLFLVLVLLLIPNWSWSLPLLLVCLLPLLFLSHLLHTFPSVFSSDSQLKLISRLSELLFIASIFL